MTDIVERLEGIVGHGHVWAGGDVPEDYTHDEALTAQPVHPLAVAAPGSTAEVSAILRACSELRVPVVARGSGTGLSGGCLPRPDGIVIAFDRMDQILEIDTANHVAVVQPGVSLAQLDEALAPHGLVYPVSPERIRRRSGATSAPTRAGCGRCATGSPATTCSGSRWCSPEARCCGRAAASPSPPPATTSRSCSSDRRARSRW